MLEIGEGTSVSPQAEISDSVRGSKIVIGKFGMIDSFVKIKPVGGNGDILIGDYCYINSGTVIFSGNGITIGNKVLIASNCSLMPVNHEYSSPASAILDQGFSESKGGIAIGDDVWIGSNSVVLDGSVVSRGCVIGAGSVVRGKLKEYGIYAGNPLVLIGTRNG